MKYGALTALVGVLTLPSLAEAKGQAHKHYESDMVRIDNASQPATTYALFRNSPYGTSAAINIYLNPNGSYIAGGWENSGRNSSGLVRRRGLRGTTIPRFRGTRRAWNAIVGCVKRRYAQFNINILTQRPRSGRYIMAMVGGDPHLLNYHRGIGGIAPFNGRIIDNAVVFIFDRSWYRTEGLCNTVVHEIGHALGLEHQYLCKDPMSYLRGCGTKTFQNIDAWCGEYSPRRCRSGSTQNTVKKLARTVGLRNGRRLPDPPKDPDVRDPDGDDDDDDDGTEPEPPVVRRKPPKQNDNHAPQITSVSVRQRSGDNDDNRVRITVSARDRGGIASVELGWTMPNGRRLVFKCGSIPRTMPVTCSRHGNRYTFNLRVGAGSRTYQVRVVDRAGNSTVTRPAQLSFSSDAVEPEPPRYRDPYRQQSYRRQGYRQQGDCDLNR